MQTWKLQTSNVTENSLLKVNLYSNPNRRDRTQQCLPYRYQVFAMIDNQIVYKKAQILYSRNIGLCL